MTAAAANVPPADAPRRGWLRGLRTLAIALLAAAFAAGCVAGFVYNRLDRLVSWYVGGYVTLDDRQEEQLRGLVKSMLAWHRVNQLPRYHDLLDGMARDIQAPVTEAQVRQRFDEMTALWLGFVDRLAGESAPLVRSLSARQVRELFENLEEENRSLWKEYGGRTTEERAERRARNAERIIKRMTGAISDGQRAQVEAATATMYDAAPQWLEHRRAWQGGFRSLLEGGAQGAEFQSALREFMLDPNRLDRPDYRERVEQNQDIVMRMLADLSVTLTPKQRQRCAGKLREYSDVVEDISRQQ